MQALGDQLEFCRAIFREDTNMTKRNFYEAPPLFNRKLTHFFKDVLAAVGMQIGCDFESFSQKQLYNFRTVSKEVRIRMVARKPQTSHAKVTNESNESC